MSPRLWSLASLCAVALACDDGSLQIDAAAQPTVALAPEAARVLISAQGLAQLTRRAADQQLHLQSAAQAITLSGQGTAQLGPLDQPLPIVSLTAQPEAGRVRTIIGLGQPAISVPLRLGSGADTRICRWRVALTSAALEVRSIVGDGGQTPATSLTAELPAQVSWASAQIAAQGACPLSAEASAQLQGALTDYTRAAIIEAAGQTAQLAPVEALGLPAGTLALTHISAFDNRRGQLVMGVSPGQTPLTLASDGLTLALDVGSLTKPASCAPQETTPSPAASPAASPDEQELRQRRADAALVLSLPALERLARGLMRAGFGCRGLEDMAAPQLATTGVLSLRDARLGDVGVITELLGDQLAAVISLDDVPRITLAPEDNLLLVQLKRLSIDLHGEVAGVTTLVATLSADVTLRLRPGGRGERTLVLSVDNAVVDSPSLASEWRGASPTGEQLTTWARRLILLLLDEEIVVPAPLLPTSPLNLIGAQVRAQDLVLYGRLAP
jgi:hypothetical protein